MSVLNDNISYLIDKNRFSQDEFAELIEVSRGMVNTWANGKASPKYDKLLLISEKFNVSCDDLLKTDLSKQKGTIGLLGAENIITMYGVAETGLQYTTQLKENLYQLITTDTDIKKALLTVVKDAIFVK